MVILSLMGVKSIPRLGDCVHLIGCWLAKLPIHESLYGTHYEVSFVVALYFKFWWMDTYLKEVEIYYDLDKAWSD